MKLIQTAAFNVPEFEMKNEATYRPRISAEHLARLWVRKHKTGKPITKLIAEALDFYFDDAQKGGEERMTNLQINESLIREEYKRAKKEGRQPNCPFCKVPIEIAHTQYTNIYWTWVKERQHFVKDDGKEGADKPYCIHCETKDWDFIDYDVVNF